MITTKITGNFITVQAGGQKYALFPPTFEADGVAIPGNALRITDTTKVRDLKNGGELLELSGAYADSPYTLTAELMRFPASPFVRYRFTLHGPGALTKRSGRETLRFTGVNLAADAKVSEFSLSTFNEMTHCYEPMLAYQEAAGVLARHSFMGPIAIAETPDGCMSMAYEHGSEYGNRFLECAVENGRTRTLAIDAVKGTYCAGEPAEGYRTPWFHCGFAPDLDALLRAYREFLLRYITENTESRKPYIFYNTWNNQERNRADRGKPYLDTMNLSQMLAEIDVAHRMGIEVFVIDTGWFDGPGDWEVNRERFPDGLKEVKARLDGYGMKLGLWFNPTAAATDSRAYAENRDNVACENGKEQFLGVIWETKESYGMCLASDYADYYIEKLLRLHEELGVTYFKWDGIGMDGCNSPDHHHGTAQNSPEERAANFSYKMGLALTHIAEEVSARCPEAIFDFDATEDGRFVGLSFLSTGKYFLINNGPYYMNFDIPNAQQRFHENVNVFFHPGTARPRICRTATKYDALVPGNLFLVHYLPDAPLYSQQASIASLVLGGNGIWGDLLSLSDDDIAVFAEQLALYKRVRDCVVGAYPRVCGFIGANPEIHEKLDPAAGGGLISFFNKTGGVYEHLTQPLDAARVAEVVGADDWRVEAGRLLITVKLAPNESRVVYVIPQGK